MRRPWFSARGAVAAILVVSGLLRLGLALRGGQYFFGDEGRYDRGVQLWLALEAGDWSRAGAIAMLPEHMLFAWSGAAVTALQHLLAQLTPYGHWAGPDAHVAFTMWIGAAILSQVSTLNLLLTHRLARVLGADEEEATWALLLMATSTVAFYYARHLLPYECALAAALLALNLGLGRPAPLRLVVAGFFIGLTYGLYNGYWYLVPVLWLTVAVKVRTEPRAWLLRAACAGGVALGLAPPMIFGSIVGGRYYWSIVRDFSGTVTQGAMAEGWSLPWEYFWHAEGVAGALLVLAIAGAVALGWRHRRALEPRARLALLALGASYGLLVLFSVGLRIFVVYARTLKPFVPLVCLLGAWALGRWFAARPVWKAALAAGLVANAAWHFAPHFTRVFPREIEIGVLKIWGNPKHTLSVTGSIYIPLDMPVARPDLVLVNAQLLYPVHETIGYPAGKTLLRFENPLSFPPFQYESHHPRERAELRAHDISIRLIQLADPASVPNDLPWNLRAQSRVIKK